MLSNETREQYRQMSPGQRLQLTFDLCRPAWSALLEGDPEIVNRRFERLEQENELRNRRICAGLRRAENLPPPEAEQRGK